MTLITLTEVQQVRTDGRWHERPLHVAVIIDAEAIVSASAVPKPSRAEGEVIPGEFDGSRVLLAKSGQAVALHVAESPSQILSILEAAESKEA